MAAELGRSPSTVADEVSRNRSVSRGPGKGGRAGEAPGDACARLLSWPRCCNGKLRRYHCSKALAGRVLRRQGPGDGRRGCRRRARASTATSASSNDDGRHQVGRRARTLPAQIAAARAGQFEVSASTIYRWIERGYAGMSSLELRRKCGYKGARAPPARGATARGEARSFAAFMGLPDEARLRLRDGHRAA